MMHDDGHSSRAEWDRQPSWSRATSNSVVEANLQHLRYGQEIGADSSDPLVEAVPSARFRRGYLCGLGVLLVAALGLIIGLAVRLRSSDQAQSPSPSDIKSNSNAVQVSIHDALLAGMYSGVVSVSALNQFGTFGVGTFDSLDGELIVLDGSAYRFYSSSGGIAAQHADNSRMVTFAFVTNSMPFADSVVWTVLPPGLVFQAGSMNHSHSPSCSGTFVSFIENNQTNLYRTLNIPYAVRISGIFRELKLTLSVQQSPPFQPYAECVLPLQPRFTLYNVSGTVLGVRSPESMRGPSLPGYFLHFISDDLQTGGHVEYFLLDDFARIALSAVNDVRVIAPVNSSLFNTMSFPYRFQDPSKVCSNASSPSDSLSSSASSSSASFASGQHSVAF